METFRVGLTADFLKEDGSIAFGDIGLDVLDATPNLSWEFLPSLPNPLPAEVVREYDGLVVLSPRVSAETLTGAGRLRIVARFGVGLDSVDVEACTRAGVVLTITRDAVRRPVAAAAMAFILGLAHRLLSKDQITREGRWASRLDYPGVGLVGRTLGIVGLGNIGREIARLARPFDMVVIAHDPFLATDGDEEGVELVGLDQLLRRADFVCVTCPLNDQTRHLIGADRLALMRPSAFLVNVARGAIVDQSALVDALRRKAIMGAGLDVFEQEPPSVDDPLFALDNVILAPHSAAWTDQFFHDTGRAACLSIATLLDHGIPANIVNSDVLKHPRLTEWLQTSEQLSV